MEPNFRAMTFGPAIKHHRKDKRLMQFQLAEKANVPVPNISAIETERYIPSFETGLQIIAALVGDEGKLEEFRREVARDKSKELDRAVKDAIKRLGLAKTDFGVLVTKLAEAIDNPPGGRPYEKFGLLLKKALEAAEIKQSDLSRILKGRNENRGNTQLISAWCDGRQAPSADLMREVVRVLRDRIPRDKVEDLRRARWSDMFKADSRFDDMTNKEREAAAKFLRDLDT